MRLVAGTISANLNCSSSAGIPPVGDRPSAVAGIPSPAAAGIPSPSAVGIPCPDTAVVDSTPVAEDKRRPETRECNHKVSVCKGMPTPAISVPDPKLFITDADPQMENQEFRKRILESKT